jgi:hypothetical protein
MIPVKLTTEGFLKSKDGTLFFVLMILKRYPVGICWVSRNKMTQGISGKQNAGTL